MTKRREHAPGFVPGQGYTQEDWDEVCDNPEWTAEDFARAVPLREAMPGLFAALGEPRPEENPAVALVTLRIDRDVLDAYQAGGAGWQDRINAALRERMPPRVDADPDRGA